MVEWEAVEGATRSPLAAQRKWNSKTAANYCFHVVEPMNQR